MYCEETDQDLVCGGRRGEEGFRMMPRCLHREAGGWRFPPCDGELGRAGWFTGAKPRLQRR